MRRSVLMVATVLAACGPSTEPTGPRPLFVVRCDNPPNVVTTSAIAGGACPVSDLDPAAPGVYNGWSEVACLNPAATADLDVDGVDDTCERALAANFAPFLRQSLSECSWAETDTQLLRLKGEYYYLVQKDPQLSMIQIVYLPSYYRDCGYHGHPGDSEFIGVKVDFNLSSNHWLTQNVFLSAHCGAEFAGFATDANCRLLPASYFAYPAQDLGPPAVWVSAEKHANYRNYADCDNAYSGSPWDEWCEINAATVRFPVTYVWQNIGSRSVPLPWSSSACPYATHSYASGYTTDPSRQECLWSDDTFRGFCGWQSISSLGIFGSCGAGYGAHLRKYFGV